jgi:transposase
LRRARLLAAKVTGRDDEKETALSMPVTIGVDAHKKTHTMVALDGVGRRLGEKTVPTTTDGHLAAVQWASQWTAEGETVRFALEDCRHLTRRLEGDLLRAGQGVVRVHTRLMADARRAVRRPGKSDPIDAEAVALAALREPNLPVAQLDGPAREVKLLVDTRADLVVQRTQAASRLRWYLHELDPALEVPSRGLRRHCVVAELTERLADEPGLVARLARDLLSRIEQLNHEINAFEREIRDRVRALAPTLLELPGCGVLAAAVLLGETADVRRFRSRDAYARFTGTAPIPVWSGNSDRVRLNRGGNRTVNCALHMIAVTQVRGVGDRGKGVREQADQRRQDKARGAAATAPAPVRCGLHRPARRRTPARSAPRTGRCDRTRGASVGGCLT